MKFFSSNVGLGGSAVDRERVAGWLASVDGWERLSASAAQRERQRL